MKNSKKTVDATQKRHAPLKKDMLERTRFPSLIKI